MDSDYVCDHKERKSLTSYVFTLFNCVVSWKTTLQPAVDLSTTEVEYMTMTEAVKKANWLIGLLGEIGLK